MITLLRILPEQLPRLKFYAEATNFHFSPFLIEGEDNAFCNVDMLTPGNAPPLLSQVLEKCERVEFNGITHRGQFDFAAIDTAEVWREHIPLLYHDDFTLPETLSHYTSAEGLIGIIKGNKLRASDIGFLNDISEFEYGRKMFKEAAEKYLKADPRFEKLLKDCDYYDSYLKYSNIFVVSLSENNDRLSQWRGYAESGLGYSLSFETRRMGMKIPSEEHGSRFFLIPVIYDVDTQNNYLKEIFEALITEYLGFLEKFEKPFLEEGYWNWFIHRTIFPIVGFKSHHFEEEKEWRLVIDQDQSNVGYEPLPLPLEFRASKNIVTPFVEVDISSNLGTLANKLPLKAVTCGPSLDQNRAVQGVKKLLYNFGFRSQVKVNSSAFSLK